MRITRNIAPLFAVLFLATAALPAKAQSTRKLCAKGEKLLKKKKFVQAKAEFAKALEDNPQSERAHYDMALVLSALRAKGEICEHGALKSTIISHLFKACRLNPKRKKRLWKEKGLKPVRDTFAYQRLVGLKTTKTKDAEKILRAVSWYGPSEEGQGPSALVKFQKKGRLQLKIRNTKVAGPKALDYQGRWRVQGSRVIVTLDKAVNGTKDFEGQLKITGELWLVGLPSPFTDDPQDCQK